MSGKSRLTNLTEPSLASADVTAEELFNMFFGGGMPSQNVYMRRNGRWTRAQQQHRARHDREEVSWPNASARAEQRPGVDVDAGETPSTGFFFLVSCFGLVVRQTEIEDHA